MKSDLTSVPAGFYRACYEHLDAGAAWYRGSGPAPQRAAGRHVPGRVHVAHQLLPAAVGDADAGGGGRGRQFGCRLITGSLLLGTVAAEAVAATAIRRFGYRMVVAAGAVLLGAPALAMLAREPQAVMVTVSLVRGLGFGMCG